MQIWQLELVAGSRRRALGGHEADQLAPAGGDAPRERLLADHGEHALDRGEVGPLDVHRDLHDASRGERQAERSHARQASFGLAHGAGDRDGDLDAIGREVDVEREQRSAHAEHHRTAPRVRPGRPGVGQQHPRGHALAER